MRKRNPERCLQHSMEAKVIIQINYLHCLNRVKGMEVSFRASAAKLKSGQYPKPHVLKGPNASSTAHTSGQKCDHTFH